MLSKVWVVTCVSKLNRFVVVFSEYLLHVWSLVGEYDGHQKQQKKSPRVLFAKGDVRPFGATQETALVRLDKSRTDERYRIFYAIFTGCAKTGDVNTPDHKITMNNHESSDKQTAH